MVIHTSEEVCHNVWTKNTQIKGWYSFGKRKTKQKSSKSKSDFADWSQTDLRDHASSLTAAAKIWRVKFQNQQAVPIRSLAFWPVDGRPHPVYVCGGVSSDLADGQPD